MESSNQNKVTSVYQHLSDAWNNQSARGMADLFAEDGELIGFDGSQSIGQAAIFEHLAPIFSSEEIGQIPSVHFFPLDIP